MKNSNIINYSRALFYAIRPFENFQHFAMTIAGFTYAAYYYHYIVFSWHLLWGFLAVFSFLSQVLSYNNYATFDIDIKDKDKGFDKKFSGINIKFLFWVSVVFFILTIIFSLLINIYIAFIFVLLMIAWITYTHPVIMLKEGRFVPYILDMFTMPFLFIFGAFLIKGNLNPQIFLFSLFWGFIEIAGHLNHITLDYEIDKQTNVRTLSVKKGPKFTFILSLIFFVFSTVYFLTITYFKVFPVFIGFIFFPGTIIHIIKAFIIMKKHFIFSESKNFRKLYRVIYFIESIILEIYMLVHIFYIK